MKSHKINKVEKNREKVLNSYAYFWTKMFPDKVMPSTQIIEAVDEFFPVHE